MTTRPPQLNRGRGIPRYFAWFAAVVVVLAGIAVLVFQFYVLPRAARERAEWVMTSWYREQPRRTADEAKADLNACLSTEEVRQSIHLTPDIVRSIPYRVLGSKYFAEGRYGLAADMYERAHRTLSVIGGPDYLNIYVAALAGRVDWLRGCTAWCPGEYMAVRDRFVLANLKWAEKDPEAVLSLADVPPEEARLPWDQVWPNLRAWLAFMRAKALLELGRAEEAYVLLRDVVIPNQHEMTTDDYFGVHLAQILVRACEEAGRHEEALERAEVLLRNMNGVVNKSWDKTRDEVSQAVTRLKSKVGPATRPKTEAAGP